MAFDTPTLVKKRGVLAALAVASVLLLSTGCTPEFGIGGALGGSGSGSSNDSDGNGKDGDKDGKDADGKDSDGKDSATSRLTGKECLPGNWIFDNDGFEKFLGSLSGNFNIAVSGNVILTLRADGSTQTNYDQWTHNISAGEGQAIVVRNGVDKGNYTFSPSGTMSMTDTSIGSITTMTINAGGQKITQSVEPEPSVFSQGAFVCNGDKLDITVDGYTAEMNREH